MKEQEKEEVQLDQSEVSTSANCVELNMLLIPEGKNIVRTSAKEKRYLHGNENTKKENTKIIEYRAEMKRGINANIEKLIEERNKYRAKIKAEEA